MAHTPEKFPSLEKLCVTTPLYSSVDLHKTQERELYDAITEPISIDCFCIECNQPSVFFSPKKDFETAWGSFNIEGYHIFNREFLCTRVQEHLIYFYFRVSGNKLEKIGQWPSLADLSETNIRRYKNVIDAAHYRELSKAVGLASHGIGIGSFVYLRRIFELLITEAAGAAAKLANWDADAYSRARMDEKIEILKDHLPRFLVEQRKIYGILSMGIHSLSEELCLEAFPVVRLGIEMILEQKLAEKIQADKMKEAAAKLEKIQARIKTP